MGWWGMMEMMTVIGVGVCGTLLCSSHCTMTTEYETCGYALTHRSQQVGVLIAPYVKGACAVRSRPLDRIPATAT